MESRQNPEEDRQTVQFSGYCRIEGHAVISDWDEVERLEPFHIWKLSLLRERFDYGNQSALHLAVVKIYRFVHPFQILYEKRYGGCRSWVQTPTKELPEATNVLDSDTWSTTSSAIANKLSTNLLHF